MDEIPILDKTYSHMLYTTIFIHSFVAILLITSVFICSLYCILRICFGLSSKRAMEMDAFKRKIFLESPNYLKWLHSLKLKQTMIIKKLYQLSKVQEFTDDEKCTKTKALIAAIALHEYSVERLETIVYLCI